MLAIPRAMLDALDLGPDAQVGLSIESGRLVVAPKRRRYSLHQLIAEHKRVRRRLPVDRDWVSGKAVGRELI
jgi:antitoxin ChpS